MNEEVEKKKRNGSLIAALVLVCVLIAGIAAGALWMQKGDNIEKLTPEQATQKMIDQYAALESAEFSGEMTMEVRNPEVIFGSPDFLEVAKLFGVEKPDNVSLSLTGATDTRESAYTGDLSFFFSVHEGEKKSSIQLDARVLDPEVQYLRMQLPQEMFDMIKTEADGFDMSFINNKWIAINVEELIDTLGIEEELARSGYDLTKAMEPTTSEEKQQFIDLFKKYPFIAITEKMGEEQLGSVDTIKYRMTLDFTVLKNFVLDAIPMLVTFYENHGISEEFLFAGTSREEVEKIIRDEFDPVEVQKLFEEEVGMDTVVWLNKKTGDLHKAQMILTPTAEDGNVKSITLTMNMSQHNKNVTIEKPDDVQSFEAILGEFILRAAGTGLEAEAGDVQNILQGGNNSTPEPAEKKDSKKQKSKKERE